MMIHFCTDADYDVTLEKLAELLRSLLQPAQAAVPAVPTPDWSTAPDWAQWHAVDEDGRAFWFERQPRAMSSQWDDMGGLWVRHTVTVTMSNSPGNLQIRLYNPKGRTYWDAVQVELGGGATGYADGDMPGHTWTGTAHASTSNRTTTAYLTYPTAGNVNALRGTIMAWVYPYSAFGAGTIWRITGAVAGYIILRTNGYNLETYWGTTHTPHHDKSSIPRILRSPGHRAPLFRQRQNVLL
jgi:hypothetical protein